MESSPPLSETVSINRLKEEIVDRILGIALVAGVLGVVASVFRALDAGWHPGFLIFVVGYIPTALLALNRGRLSLAFKSWASVGMLFFYGAAMIVAFGLLSASLTVLVLHGVVTTILIGPRAGLASVAVCFGMIGVSGFLHTNELVSVAIAPADFAYSVNSWLAAGLSFLILSTIIASIIGTLLRSLETKIAEEQSKREHLEDEITAFENILPICAWCRRIRDDQSDWLDAAEYVTRHGDHDVSHTICPDCTAQMRGSSG